MEAQELKEIEQQAAEVAWGAGRLLLGRFQQPMTVEWKGKRAGRDPVTDVDRQVESYIAEELTKRFPSHAIVGEEGAGKGSAAAPCTWVVDALDGTTNFFNGLPAFACSIGLLEHGAPVAAVVFVPWPVAEGGMVLHASKGGGTWAGTERLTLQQDATLAGRLVVLPRGAFRLRGESRRAGVERRSVGSIAYELAATALGIYQYVLFASPRIWDVGAGALLVREAGGAVMTYQGGKAWTASDALAERKSDAKDAVPGALGQDELREWSRPVLAGSRSAVERVAHDITPYRPLLPALARLLRGAAGTGRGAPETPKPTPRQGG